MQNIILQGDSLTVLKTLEAESVDCVITSPPYWGLRDYGVGGQLGLEKTPEEYVANMVAVFSEVKRVMKKEGTCWLNLGDSYATSHETGTTDKAKGWTSATGIGGRQLEHARAGNGGLPSKNLVGIPWRVAFALQADGWYLRQDIIWAKPNPMPESVTDRCTKSHEYIFLLTKSPKYYFDNEAIKEPAIYGQKGLDNRPAGVVRNREYDYNSKQNNNPEAYLAKDSRAGKGRIAYTGKRTADTSGKNGQESFVSIAETRNKRSVWTVTTKPFKEAHFATFPEALIEPMVLAGCPKGGIVLDIFMGAGTTAVVAKKNKRNYLGIELNPSYIEIAERRIAGTTNPMF